MQVSLERTFPCKAMQWYSTSPQEPPAENHACVKSSEICLFLTQNLHSVWTVCASNAHIGLKWLTDDKIIGINGKAHQRVGFTYPKSEIIASKHQRSGYI